MTVIYKNSFNETEKQPHQIHRDKHIELSIDAGIYTISIKTYFMSTYTTKTIDKALSFDNVNDLKSFIKKDNACDFCICDLFNILDNK